MPTTYRRTLTAAAVLTFLALAQPAAGHDGEHPVACGDVRVPQGADCHEPGSEINHDEHPLCIVNEPGDGSAAGSFRFVECLPETGAVPVLPMMFVGGLTAGAGVLALRATDTQTTRQEK